MLRKILSGLFRTALLGCGGFGIFSVIRLSPSLKMYFVENGVETVRIMGHDIQMGARFYVVCSSSIGLLFTVSGFLLLWFASRKETAYVV